MATATATATQLTASELRRLSDQIQDNRWGACSCVSVKEVDNWLNEAAFVRAKGAAAIAAGARKCNQARLDQVVRDVEQLDAQIQSTRDRRFRLEMAEVAARCEAIENSGGLSNVVAFPVR
jgi:hypothetical protein